MGWDGMGDVMNLWSWSSKCCCWEGRDVGRPSSALCLIFLGDVMRLFSVSGSGRLPKRGWAER